ncbi:MAG: site-specific integrase [Planctomycetota bacterium]
MRGPSEITPLKWSDISWERGRFTVTSQKTKRYGKATRVVPLFEELRKELTDLLEIKGHSSPFVITRYCDSTTSLSTRFNATCVRAGVAEMPKPFPNLRASARRDLKQFCAVRNIDPAAVTAWLGHDATTAEKYYDQVTDDDYDRTVGTLVCTSATEHISSLDVRANKKPRKTGALMLADGSGSATQYTPEDSNL